MLRRTCLSSDEIVQSSSEIASGALELSWRNEQTAANLKQSSASFEQNSATLKNTSADTDEAAKVARRNAVVAAEGGRETHSVVETMDGIRSSEQAKTLVAEVARFRVRHGSNAKGRVWVRCGSGAAQVQGGIE